jgi:hypothetical protein
MNEPFTVDNSRAWYTWIITTVVWPGGSSFFMRLLIKANMSELVAGIIFFLMVALGILTLVLHFKSSIKLSQDRSVWLTLGLVFGGWALMIVLISIGCGPIKIN